MILHLPLKKKWFDMTKEDIKPEDYREISEFWFIKLVHDYKKVFKYCTGHEWNYLDKQTRDIYIRKVCSDKFKVRMIGFKQFKVNVMTLGYPKSTDHKRILRYEHKGIEIRTGNPDWGAEPGKLYFVIKHGSLLFLTLSME